MTQQAYGNLQLALLFAEPGNRPSWMPLPFAGANIDPADIGQGLVAGPGPTIIPKPPPPTPQQIPFQFDQRTTIHPWFDEMHVVPRRLDLGRVLATTNIPMTVHNAYRTQTWTWNSFVNNAGAGTELTGPTPPQILSPQESTQALVLVVTTDGVPVVDTTLDFGFTSGDLIPVPIIFSRLVFFPLFPEKGFREELGWLCEVFKSKDGTEKRSSVRRFPRVRYRLRFRLDGPELALLHNVLLGRPGATYGIPLWHESTVLSADVATDDVVIPVQDTRWRQFRDDGVGVIYDDRFIFDIFQIASFTDTVITPVNPVVLSLPKGTRVMPVRLATTPNRQSGRRFPISLGDMELAFDVRDVDEDLSDLSEWGTYDGKPFIDDCNAIGRGSVREGVQADLVVLDNDVGPRQQFSYEPNAKWGTQKQWAPSGIEKLWYIRQLLYALRGRQTSFFMPTNREDLKPIAPLAIGDKNLSIEYVGYNYVFGNGYRDNIRVTLVDGTQLTRKVDAAAQNEAQTEEYLTVDTNWPANVPVADIARIEFLQNLRLNTDSVTLRYEPGRPGARVSFPVTSVLGEAT